MTVRPVPSFEKTAPENWGGGGVESREELTTLTRKVGGANMRPSFASDDVLLYSGSRESNLSVTRVISETGGSIPSTLRSVNSSGESHEATEKVTLACSEAKYELEVGNATVTGARGLVASTTENVREGGADVPRPEPR